MSGWGPDPEEAQKKPVNANSKITIIFRKSPTRNDSTVLLEEKILGF